jgi:type I restriction enzyme S subunit
MLLSSLNLLAQAPNGVARLRELILTLAVQGKLVPQDPKDEPASALLKKIRAEKDRLIAAKTLKREKDEPALTDDAPPFDLPVTWGWVALGEVIDIVRGITFPATQKTREAAPGRIACLRTTNVQQTIEWEDLLFVDRSFMGRADQLIQHHDIVMSMANSRELVGKVALIDQIPHAEATFGGFLGVLRPRKIDPLYAMAVLRTPYARSLLIDSSSQTTNIANVSLAKLRPLPFPLPPEAEQSRIVTRVEELMRLCDALEAKAQLQAAQHAQLVSTLLATLTDSETPAQLADNWHRIATHFDLLLDRPEAVDALEQTILQLAVRGLLVPQDPQDEPASKLLGRIQRARTAKRKITKPDDEVLNAVPHVLPNGWEWAAVDQVSADTDTAITDGPFGANLKTEHYVGASGFRVIRLQNIGEGKFRKEHHAYIDQARFERLNKHQIFAGDIVVAGLVDESIRCCIVPPDVGPAIVKADCYRFSVHESLSTQYICLYLSSNFAHEFASIHHHGLTLTRIGLGNFRSIPVPIPPAAEQSRIVTRVAQLRRLCADLRQRLTASQSTQAHLAEALVDTVG